MSSSTSTDEARLTQTTLDGRGRVADNPPCQCGCSVTRPVKKPPKERCQHTTRKLQNPSVYCPQCKQRNDYKKGHHLGCPDSKFFGITHHAIAKFKDDQKSSNFLNGKLTRKDAEGTAKLTNFFAPTRKQDDSRLKPSTTTVGHPTSTPRSPETPEFRKRLLSAATAVGAISPPPTPEPPQTRTTSTSIGNGGAAAEENRDLVLFPTPEDIDADDKKETKILPVLEALIKQSVEEMPRLC